MASRSSTLAALEAGADEGTDTTAAPPQKQTPAPKPAPAAQASAPAEDDPPDEKPAEKPAGKPPAREEPKNDPELAKRLAAINDREARHAAKVTEDRKHDAAERQRFEAEWAPRVKAAQEFETLRAQAKRGAGGMLAALRGLGFTEADFGTVAQVAYAHSPEGQKDTSSPQRKAAAERAMAEKYRDDDVAELRQELDALKQEKKVETEKASFETAKAQYLDVAVKAISDASPIAKKLAAKNPAKLRAQLWAVADELGNENGEVPTFEELIERYEETRRAELADLDIDITKLSPSATPEKTETETKKNTQVADKKNTAKTTETNPDAKPAPRSRHSAERARRAKTLEELEALG